MERLENFFEESALDFGPAHNLAIAKLRRTLPWEVNAALGGDTAAGYRDRLADIDALDEAAWQAFEPGFLALDKEVSAGLARRDVPHYAIRYNEFMAVWTA
jgi:hypothetical protein